MKTMNSDPVQDYILEDENKLRIAAAVFNAWPEVRKTLGWDFLGRLQSALEEKLKGWKFERWGCPFIDSAAGFSFWKPAWKAEYYVSLELLGHGEFVTFGLGRDASQEHIRNRSHCPELLPALSKRYATARATNCWWEAWVGVQSPAADWRKPGILWQMRTDPKFLEDVAEQLLGVAEISEPIVDRFVDGLTRKE